MKFVYGKQDWKTFERGEENCYLMANGLGGFSSLTVTGSCSRNDHAVLMACVHSPNHRYNMIHRLEEVLHVGDRKVHISSQDNGENNGREEGWLYQTGFSYGDYPQWTYLVDGVEVVKTIALAQGSNTVGISYEIRNFSGKDVKLDVYPHLQFVPKGALLDKGQEFVIEGRRISAGGQSLFVSTDGTFRELPLRFHDSLFYAYDICDGRPETGCTAVNHVVSAEVPARCGKLPLGKTLHMVYGMGAEPDHEPELPSMEEIIRGVEAYRNGLRKQAGFPDGTASVLAAGANQFVSHRESTGKKTILAGFPFFEDWGRDTMIAVSGCCLATGQYGTAKSILQTFMAYCQKGLMPNLFPEGSNAARYNTVDAALLFVLAVYEYYGKTKDGDFVKSAYGTMAEIVEWYEKGTDYGIKMDEDGLITAGSGYDQVTWMDVRVGDILPTPRHGKPVEINAYWYNALRIMEEFAPFGAGDGKDYGRMVERVKESFGAKFWNDGAGCLKDVLSGTEADGQIRCNQIWAVSLPFSVLSPERERQVVEVVFRELYTPYGLRTLSPQDKEFHAFYGGKQLERDLAYHQGTVWVFPLGGYYLAYLKVNGYTEEAKACVRRQLEVMDAALREGCIGQLPEIYDGGNPVSSKGCFAQAWSVGEILRVYDALR